MENIIELDIEALRKAKTSLEKAYRIYLQGSDDEVVGRVQHFSFNPT